MKCHNCEFVECAKCQAELVAHCPKCARKAERDEDRGESRETPPCPELGSSEEGGA